MVCVGHYAGCGEPYVNYVTPCMRLCVTGCSAWVCESDGLLMDLGHRLPLGRKGWVLYGCRTLRGMRVVLFDVLRYRWQGLPGRLRAIDSY